MKGKLLTKGIGLLLVLMLFCTGLMTASADTPAAAVSSGDAAQNTATGGIDVTIVFSRTSYKIGSTLEAKYTVKGGSGTYKELYCWCYSADHGQAVFSKYIPLKSKSGTIKFKPKYGQEAYIELYALDSKGKYANVTSDRVALTGAKETEPIQVTITFSKDSYALGETVVADYKVTGGSGKYPVLEYAVYGGENGASVSYKRGTLKSANGKIKFVPYKGSYAYISLWGNDSDNRSVSFASNPVDFTDAAVNDPVKVKITFNKSSYKSGETVVAKYKITGGSGKYKQLRFECSGAEHESSLDYADLSYKSGDLTASSGTIKFVPKSGVKARVSITGFDSKGKGVFGQSGWVKIKDAKNREGVNVKFTLSKTSYTLGTRIKAKYSISGGSGKYTNLSYSCYVYDNGQYKDYENGTLKKDSGTITFAPNRGQEAYIYVYGTDSEGRNIWGQSVTIQLTESTKPNKVKLTGVKAGQKQLTVTWSQGKDIDGYQIQYGRKADFSDAETVSVKKATVTEKTITKLKGGKKYYVRVRTFRKVNGKNVFSDWSESKSKKTTK